MRDCTVKSKGENVFISYELNSDPFRIPLGLLAEKFHFKQISGALLVVLNLSVFMNMNSYVRKPHK